ncbi:RNA-binding protein, CCR4-NOT complex subunit Rcd1 [Spiromyces aspiralis]|uniref:RNA-binding protein, CCR4-NOT complex subunit Rcd1 n=1 Tax=Spiromyces aspiralis TaxID=68401 RepID=A0ACC1HS26_9FUNG|nr:RNA-binding protein, CCR4-NOT complex subunit Rcd1 [Spiromyces aspiralis]
MQNISSTNNGHTASLQQYLLQQQQQPPHLYGQFGTGGVGGGRVPVAASSGGAGIGVGNYPGTGHLPASSLASTGASAPSIDLAAGGTAVNEENAIVYGLMVQLFDQNTREQALAELSKRRDQCPDLAVALWNSMGVMSILYQEIISVYPLLTPTALSVPMSNRVCNALALLQLVATHEQTRMQLLKANVPQLLYPLLSTREITRQFDNLRLTGLGVIGALVKYDNPEVINFFVTTEFLPLCLQIMENAGELCKVVATFIFQKIITDEGGFKYITSHPKRLRTVIAILNLVVEQMVSVPSSRLLKSVSKCFLRLADDPATRRELKESMSEYLKKDDVFLHIATEDVTFRRLLFQIHLKILTDDMPSSSPMPGAVQSSAAPAAAATAVNPMRQNSHANDINVST